MANEFGYSSTGSISSQFALWDYNTTAWLTQDTADAWVAGSSDVITKVRIHGYPSYAAGATVKVSLIEIDAASPYPLVQYASIVVAPAAPTAWYESSTVSFSLTAGKTYRWAIDLIAGGFFFSYASGTGIVNGPGIASPSATEFSVGGGTNPYRLLIAADVTSGPPLPNITSISDTTPSHGATITITGTNFGATQGQVSFTSSITSWSDTSIIAVFDRGNAANGEAVDIIVGDASDNFSDHYAVTVQPPVGWQYVVVGASLVPVDDRPSGTPTDITTGNQLEWNNSDVTIRDDLSAYLADGISPPQTIPYRIHDGTEWGTTGTLTISTSGVPGIPSVPSLSTSLVTWYTAVSNSIH